MKPQVVRFASHPHSYRVEATRCANPDCDCVDVNLRFVQVSEDGEASEQSDEFKIVVIGETFEEINPPTRPAAIASAVQEFLRDYPAHEKAQLKEATREKREIARRLHEYRLDPQILTDGRLVTYGQIASEEGSISTGGKLCVDRFTHEDATYFIDDLYCPRPSCDCRSVHLLFLKQHQPKTPSGPFILKDHFLAILEFGGNLTIEHCSGATQQEALAIANAWREENGDDMETFKWRYRKIKEVARRSAPPAATRIAASQVANREIQRPHVLRGALRPGRNDPCPCGSGRKYKKCCGG